MPLPIPPVLRPIEQTADADVYEITQRVGSLDILPGLSTPVLGYDGIFPGPTIVSRSGRPTKVIHTNTLAVPTVVHLHGGHTPADSDGYPTDFVLPVGESTHPPGMVTSATSHTARASTCTPCSNVQPRSGTTTTAWTSPAPRSTAGWPASTWCTTTKRRRCRSRVVLATSR